MNNRADITKPIQPNEVEYLSFEGGGGKGNAFLGAIHAMEEDLKILKFDKGKINNNPNDPNGCKIKGISGASAGAITALLLASGFNANGIEAILRSTKFNEFFDGPNPAIEIKAGTNSKLSKNEYKIQNYTRLIEGFYDKIIPSFFRNNADASNAKSYSYDRIEDFIIDRILSFVQENQEIPQDLKLKFSQKSSIREYLHSIILDFGLFPGYKIHDFFNKTITAGILRLDENYVITKLKMDFKQIKKDLADGSKWWNFKDHFEVFGMDIRFTSVNLRTEQVQIFSKDTTPLFPVATAARMSMSLPLIFKPVQIDKKIRLDKLVLAEHYEGLWVDGGLFDNAPIRTFNSDNAILLRLGNRQANNPLRTLFDFLTVWIVHIGVFGSGAGQVTQSTYPLYARNIIELDVAGTDLLKFELSPSELNNLKDKNIKRVNAFFKRKEIWDEKYKEIK